MLMQLRCRCGSLQGEVESSQVAARARCYCRDCQAYARFLGADARVLDAAGGTEIAAVPPAALRFTAGQAQLACMSLGPRGIYRWYAACCATPIGNTPRDPHLAYVGLVRQCLLASDAELAQQCGRQILTAHRAAAHGPTRATPVASVLGVFKIVAMLARARLTGAWRRTPFFDAAGMPVPAPRVLTREERAALTR